MSILVVCEHTMFRDGLGLLLQSRVSEAEILFAESSQKAAALRRLGRFPSVILLDLALAEYSGQNAVGILREAYPASPLIGLAEDRHQPEVLGSLRSGVKLCVLKSASAELLIAAMQVAESSAVCLPSAALPGGEVLLPEATLIRGAHPTPADLGLTPKQSRVLQLLLQGKSAKGIARDLGLCTGTVKTHTTAVLRALNVNTRVQAVLAARRMGLQVDVCH
jgi:DNA-binding NarL/FixJ family response regulator